MNAGQSADSTQDSPDSSQSCADQESGGGDNQHTQAPTSPMLHHPPAIRPLRRVSLTGTLIRITPMNIHAGITAVPLALGSASVYYGGYGYRGVMAEVSIAADIAAVEITSFGGKCTIKSVPQRGPLPTYWSAPRRVIRPPCRIQSAIMRIGLFGGSFDPPHLGHLGVAIAAAQAFSLNDILLAPTGRQPLKTNGASASFDDRLTMVSLLCELQPRAARPRLAASSLDAPHADGSPNYTVDTLSKLRGNCSTDDTLFALVGADAFLDLRRWRSSDRLLELAEWIVVSRAGVSLQQLQGVNLTPEQLSRVHFLEGVHEPASATDIRELLNAGSDGSGLLPDSILNYIRAHHLYGT